MAVLGEAMRACEARIGAVALRDPEERTGALYVIDERARKMKRVPFPDDVGLIGWAIRNNEVLVTSDAENDSRRDAAFDERVGGAKAKTAIAVPLEGEQRARPWARSPSTTSAAAGRSPTRIAGSSSSHRERVDGHPPAALARGPRARGAPDDHRPAALQRHPRPEDAADGHQRLRAADAELERPRPAREVRRAGAPPVRPHRGDAARGARVRARREERAGAQGVPAEVLRRRARPARGRPGAPRDRARASTCRSAAPRGSTRARSCASCTTWRATRPRPWAPAAASSSSRSRATRPTAPSSSRSRTPARASPRRSSTASSSRSSRAARRAARGWASPSSRRSPRSTAAPSRCSPRAAGATFRLRLPQTTS